MKKLLTWSVALLLLWGASSCRPNPEPNPKPVNGKVVYNLPIIDYDFTGTSEDIIAFEKTLGHTLDKKQSNANTLAFKTGQKEFSETLYLLGNKRIIEIYQPCSDGEAVEKILPQLTEELEKQGWIEWSTPVNNGESDAAFVLTRTINGQKTQIGSVLVYTRVNNVKKTYPGVFFIFSRATAGVDPNTVELPDLYLDGLGKTKEEIKAYYKSKGVESVISSSFLRAKVDNPAYKNEVCFFFKDGDTKCHSVIMTAVNFRINKSENLNKQLKELGFEFDSEESGAISKFINEDKGIWAFVRFRPLSQFDQPNLTFTKKPSNF